MSDIARTTSDVTLYDENGNKVNIELDDSIYRLSVSAKLDESSLTFQLNPFTPIFDFDATSTVTLNTSTDTSLKLINDIGKIDFIALAGSSANYEVVLKIDGTEILRINMGELGSDIGLANATNVPLWAETANKNFRYSPKQGVDFTSSFELLAKATSATPTVNWLVSYRIQA